MAGSIPPLVSSSPPPLCDYDDDEEAEDEDEFGLYTTAQDLDYNECISFEKKGNIKEHHCLPHGEQDSTSQDSATDSGLCPDSEGMSPTPHSDDERTVKNIVCDKLFQKTTDLPVLSSRLTQNGDSDSCDQFGTGKVEESTSLSHLTNGFRERGNNFTDEVDEEFGNFENCMSSPCTYDVIDGQNIATQAVSSLETKEAEEPDRCVPEECVKNEQQRKNSTESIHPKISIQSVEAQDIDSDNITFNLSHISVDNVSDHEVYVTDQAEPVHNCSKDIENGVIESVDNNEAVDVHVDDDDFNDFADFTNDFPLTIETTETNLPLNEQSNIDSLEQSDEPEKSVQIPLEESDDEFSNFADFSSSDCAFVSAQSSNSLENVHHIPFKSCDDNSIRTESDFQDWVSVFPLDNASEDVSPGELADLLGKGDIVWSRLFPLETSPALSHQWTNSLTNRYLLSALNIDSRNILFMPWNSSTMPRFVANLARGPLEPVKAIEPLPLPPTPVTMPPVLPAPSSTQESVPDAHFDWIGSGLTNPLDYPKPVLNMKKQFSAEAVNIIRSLPDLAFMRKTYINFPINEA